MAGLELELELPRPTTRLHSHNASIYTIAHLVWKSLGAVVLIWLGALLHVYLR